MKTGINLCLILSYSLLFSQENKGIKIFYSFKDENPKLLEKENESNVLVINFQDYILEGNSVYSEFYVVKDLAFENRVSSLIEQKSPIKSRAFSFFYNGKYNIDYDNDTSYAELEFGNQQYLVIDSVKNINWEVNRKKKKVLNFEVKQAVFEDSTRIVEAWYAPKLPFKIGPLNYVNLPGTILELIIKMKGENQPIYHLWAYDVKLYNKSELSLPENMKVVTQEEFDSIYKEYQEKMLEMQSQGVDTSD